MAVDEVRGCMVTVWHVDPSSIESFAGIEAQVNNSSTVTSFPHPSIPAPPSSHPVPERGMRKKKDKLLKQRG